MTGQGRLGHWHCVHVLLGEGERVRTPSWGQGWPWPGTAVYRCPLQKPGSGCQQRTLVPVT
eukprot:7754542-Pyramimonas_sp.AAC.1